MNELNKLVSLLKASDRIISVVEARSKSSDMDTELVGYTKRLNDFINPDVIKWWTNLLDNNPKEKEKFLIRAKSLMNKASNATNPITQLYLEFRIILSPDKAKMLALQFYQKEMRSKTFSFSDNAGEDSDSGDLSDYTVFNVGYSALPNDQSWFLPAYNQLKHSDPSRRVELSELFNYLFNKAGLSHEEKLVLCTKLAIGANAANSGRGKTGQGIKASRLELETVMKRDDLPIEYYQVSNKIDEILNMPGFTTENITSTWVLRGGEYQDDFGKYHRVEGLLKGDKNKISGVYIPNIKRAIAKIAGVNDIEDYKTIKNFYAVIGEKYSKWSTLIDIILEGGKINDSELYQLISYLVYQNVAENTLLSKTFTSDFKSVVMKYFKNAKTASGQIDIQNLIMAPAIKDAHQELGLIKEV